jgi:hypothetical protein
MDHSTLSRRRFLCNVAVVAVPVTAISLRQTASAQELAHVTLDDPTAKALLYVHDASQVDTSNPMAARYAAGQTCENCIQIQGDAGSEWRPCALFPGKAVASAGWCSVWALKP